MRLLRHLSLALPLLACAPDGDRPYFPPEPDGGLSLDVAKPGPDSPPAMDSGLFLCASEADCRDPARPLCDRANARCAECADDARCSASDHCDRLSGTCAPGCSSDQGCAQPTPRCLVTAHDCVECVAGTDCPPGHACTGSVCTRSVCPEGRADCNRSAADGCEADLARDPANCGACGARARETCDLRDDNCDGACDNVDGCRVGVHRSLGGEHFYTVNLTEAMCCGFRVEFANFFYLYAGPAPGTVALRRCYSGALGRHLMTTRADCEGYAFEGVMGYLATTAACGATPLYRLRNGANDNFYTTSAAERDNAVMRFGYTALELAGYVWTAPRGG